MTRDARTRNSTTSAADYGFLTNYKQKAAPGSVRT